MGDAAGGAGTEIVFVARYVLDEEEVARLEQAILADGRKGAVIDLSGVGRCTGLGAWSLARLQSEARADGIIVRVRSLSAAVYETLDQTGLDAVLLVDDYTASTDRLSTTIGSLEAHRRTRSSDGDATSSTSLASTSSVAATSATVSEVAPDRRIRSSARTETRPPADSDTDAADPPGTLRRSVRFYATRASRLDRSSHPTPFLLFEAVELVSERRRGPFRRRASYEDVGFARLDPGSKLMPVAPRWSIVLDAPAGVIRLQLGGVDLFAIPEEQVPEVWRLAAAEWGTCHVVTGVGLELERDHPFLASKRSMELGACFGAVVLVDVVVD